MPPDGCSTIIFSEDVFEQLTLVMAEYDCDSLADAVETVPTVALEHDEAELAQILVGRLEKDT